MMSFNKEIKEWKEITSKLTSEQMDLLSTGYSIFSDDIEALPEGIVVTEAIRDEFRPNIKTFRERFPTLLSYIKYWVEFQL